MSNAVNSYASFRERMECDSLRLFIHVSPGLVTAELFLEILGRLEKDVIKQGLSLLTDHRRKQTTRPPDRRRAIRGLFDSSSEELSFSLLNSEQATWHDGYVFAFHGKNDESIGVRPYIEIWLAPPESLKMSKVLELAGVMLGSPFISWTPPAEDAVLRHYMTVATNPEQGSKRWPESYIALFPKINLVEFAINSARDLGVGPDLIGWANYWSPQICSLMGFPNPSVDERVLKYSYQLSDGAWILVLTKEPLNFTYEDHILTVQWAYERFGPRKQR